MPDDRLAYESRTPDGTADGWRAGWLDLTGRVRAEIPQEEKMGEVAEDIGVIIALVKRFTEQRLPKMIAVKERVEMGECLSEYDIKFLDGILKDANRVMPLVDKHPEWQPLTTRAISLYKEITEKALENEKQS
jgi:hypothetical protein